MSNKKTYVSNKKTCVSNKKTYVSNKKTCVSLSSCGGHSTGCDRGYLFCIQGHVNIV